MLVQDVVKRVEFVATVCSDNTLHDDHALSSMKQVHEHFLVHFITFQVPSMIFDEQFWFV